MFWISYEDFCKNFTNFELGSAIEHLNSDTSSKSATKILSTASGNQPCAFNVHGGHSHWHTLHYTPHNHMCAHMLTACVHLTQCIYMYLNILTAFTHVIQYLNATSHANYTRDSTIISGYTTPTHAQPKDGLFSSTNQGAGSTPTTPPEAASTTPRAS